MTSFLELFVSVDDFCQKFLPFWEAKLLEDGSKKRRRAGRLSISEIMTIMIYFHQSQFITKLKKNMKNRLLPLIDKLLLRKRAIIESVVDQLKNISQIEHTRHRSLTNCFINIIAGLIAYYHQPTKPSLNLFPSDLLSA